AGQRWGRSQRTAIRTPAPRAVRSVRARYARNYPLRVAVLFAGAARDGLLAAFKAFAKSSRRSDPGASDS
ncbi:hypothetical protein ACFVXQ_01180, partial [Kitasatospora sp. NPDC058263]